MNSVLGSAACGRQTMKKPIPFTPGLRTFVFSVLCIVLCWVQALCQQRASLEGEVALGTVFSSNTVSPFWLRTNQYGIIPEKAPSGILQLALQKGYQSPDSVHHRKFDWGFRVNPVVTVDRQNSLKVLLPEVNLSVRFKAFEVYAGRRRQVTGLGDTTLTSGFYAVSGNALPLPKLQIATVGYASLPFTNNLLAINAGFAHGWYKMATLQGVRLHQKYVYVRLGKPTSRVRGYVGLNHQVQWAGHAEYLKQRPDIADANGYFPSSWKFYKYVVFSYTPKDWAKVAGYTSFDSYRVGNSLGSIDFGFELALPSGRWLAYHQHAYDDVSGIVFKNVPDGLWGLSYHPSVDQRSAFRINRLTAEFLTTTNQSGSTFYVPGSSYQGGDNYYNHGQYTEGWSYFGRTIGTPFIAPGSDFPPSLGLSTGPFFPNNRVTMGYLAAQAIYRKITVQLRASYSKNAGTFSHPLMSNLSQFSALASVRLPILRISNTWLEASIAMDKGDLYTNTIGSFISLKKNW